MSGNSSRRNAFVQRVSPQIAHQAAKRAFAVGQKDCRSRNQFAIRAALFFAYKSIRLRRIKPDRFLKGLCCLVGSSEQAVDLTQIEVASGKVGTQPQRFANVCQRFLFGTNDPLPMLHECGFRHVRSVSFDQACLSLTGTYERSRQFRFQHIVHASRARAMPIV